MGSLSHLIFNTKRIKDPVKNIKIIRTPEITATTLLRPIQSKKKKKKHCYLPVITDINLKLPSWLCSTSDVMNEAGDTIAVTETAKVRYNIHMLFNNVLALGHYTKSC